MTHLRIEQNNGITEQVSPSVIEKLYEIVHSGNLDSSSNLMGSLNTTGTYLSYVDYLEELFTKNGVRLLVITANKLYMDFADPAVLSRMMQYLGDGVGIMSSEITNGNWYSSTTDPNTNSTLFKNNTSITSFNELGLLSLITNIPANTFQGCTNLTTIDLHNITSIGHYAFDSSGITEADLSSILTLGAAVFKGCSNLESVTIGSGISSIDNLVFLNCTSLQSVIFPNTITEIRGLTFQGCTNLLCIDLSNIVNLGEGSFRNCTLLVDLSTNDINIINTGSDTYTFDWTTLLNSCFYYVPLTNKSLIFPELLYVGQNTFLYSSVKSLNMPKFIQTNGEWSFCNNTNLQTVIFGDAITSLGSYSFAGDTSLTTVIFGANSSFSLGGYCFDGCTNLTTLTNITNCTKLGNNVFRNCSNLGNNETLELNLTAQDSNPEEFLSNTKYKGLIIHWPNSIPNGWRSNYPLWSYMAQLEYLDISDTKWGVDNRGNNSRALAFYGNTNIKTVILSPDYNYIWSGKGVFWSRPGFQHLIILNDSVIGIEFSGNDFFGIALSPQLIIYVPDSLVSSYLADATWSQIPNISSHLKGLSELPAGVWTTGLAASKYHFFNDPEVTRVLTLAYAVEDNVALTNSDIASIISNDGYTNSTFSFKDNTNLVDFSDLNKLTNVTWLNYEAFDGCTSLQNINLSNIVNLSYMGGMTENYTFRNCSSLEYIYLPNATRSPLYRLCLGCTSLKLYIAPNVTNIERLDGPFINCLNLKGIFIPKGNMGGSPADLWHRDSLVGSCKNIKVVDVDIITSINEYTFRYNTSLSAVIFRNTTTVPTLTGETSSYFSNITFYVDDSMLTAYQADSAWSNANIHLDVISNFVLANHLDSDTLALYNSIVSPS